MDDGCGREVECPNNCTGVNTCGGGGEQFKCGCEPLDCLNLGAECGLVDNGCGETIDCGGCGEYPYVTCGGEGAPNEFGQAGEPAQENICNGGCTLLVTSSVDCENFNHPPKMYACSAILQSPPFDGCEKYSFDENPGNLWCCPVIQ